MITIDQAMEDFDRYGINNEVGAVHVAMTKVAIEAMVRWQAQGMPRHVIIANVMILSSHMCGELALLGIATATDDPKKARYALEEAQDMLSQHALQWADVRLSEAVKKGQKEGLYNEKGAVVPVRPEDSGMDAGTKGSKKTH
jgi:hypothetical protein